jgi:ribosomal protein S12 methylthiotransferase
MPGQIPFGDAMDRLDALMRVQERLSLDGNQRLVGRRLPVLVERKAPEQDVWFGRSYRDAPEIDCEVKVRPAAGDDDPVIGEFCRVQVVRAEVHDLEAVPASD